MEYTVILEKGEGGYWAYSTEVPGCTSFGKSAESATENMRQALKEHLQLMRESGEEMPETKATLITKVTV